MRLRRKLSDLRLVANVSFFQMNLRSRKTIAKLLLEDRHLSIDDPRHRNLRARGQKMFDHRAPKRPSPASDYRNPIFKQLHLRSILVAL